MAPAPATTPAARCRHRPCVVDGSPAMRTDSETVAATPTTAWVRIDHRGTAPASASTGTAAGTPRRAGRPVIRPASATTTVASRPTSVASWT